MVGKIVVLAMWAHILEWPSELMHRLLVNKDFRRIVHYSFGAVMYHSLAVQLYCISGRAISLTVSVDVSTAHKTCFYAYLVFNSCTSAMYSLMAVSLSLPADM